MKKFQLRYFLIFILLPVTSIGALTPSPDKLELNAPSVLLLDQSTAEILYEKNADQIIAPASLTKLMSLHIVYEKIKQGAFTKDTLVPIRNSAWALRLPRRTSRMFLEPGQKVTVFELMQGMAIPSGNDAAVALAEFVAGSVEQFTQLMNEEAKKLGFSHLYFEDASGLSEKNTITAREFAFFCHKYLELHPESITELHMHQEFTYPLTKNLPDTHRRNARPIKQRNRNSLLRKVTGVDGLKTGYIDESGFNIAFTVNREGTRLVGVILGVRGKTLRQGAFKRAQDGKKLIEYGYALYETVKPALKPIEPVKVWKGKEGQVQIVPGEKVAITVKKSEVQSIKATTIMQRHLTAPVVAGQVVGVVILSSQDKVLKKIPLVAQSTVPVAGFFKWLWDSLVLVLLFFLNIF